MAIVSHRHRFIFVKTTKTAGTSIEVALAEQCGPEDVVTPIFPTWPGHEPRNHVTPTGGRFNNHMSAQAIRDLVGADVFSSYFTFCVERHPVDKSLSHFAMKKYSPEHRTLVTRTMSWERYVRRGRFPTNHRKYLDADGQTLLVDRILKFESLEQELQDVFAQLGLEWRGLPRAKAGYRNGDVPRPEDVTPEQRAAIMARFAKSNEITGYR